MPPTPKIKHLLTLLSFLLVGVVWGAGKTQQALNPIMVEVASGVLSGNSKEENELIFDEAADQGKRTHLAVRATGNAAINIFAGGKFLAKLPELAESVARKMATGKSVRKFTNLTDLADDLAQIFRKKLDDLGDIKKKQFLDDFDNATDHTREQFLKNPDLVDNWIVFKNKGLDDLARNPNALKYFDDLKGGIKLGDAPRIDYRKTFKEEAFSEIADQVHQVHHAVPQKIKNVFGKIDDPQLHSLENLRGIPKADKAFHQTITNKWEQWFIENPNFTLDDALKFAKKIDDEFGHRFIPPIR